jgi:Rrf2 family protein
MRVSYKCDYALKVLLELTLSVDKGVLSSQELAKKLDIPVKFLEQVLSDLRKGGFVESKRGNLGGYMLIGNPAGIMLGKVVRHIDGPIEPIECINPEYKNCKDVQHCVYRNVWCRVNKAITDIVDHISLEDMARDVRLGQNSFNYSI